MTLHERVIGCDIGLTLCAVDQKRFDFSRGAGVEFYSGWKARAAHTRDARITHSFNQCSGVCLMPVANAAEREPLIQTVSLNDDAMVLKPGGMGDGAQFNGGHDARGGCVHRHTHHALRLGKHLAPLH